MVRLTLAWIVWVLYLCHGFAQAQGAAYVRSAHGDKTAHIEIIGTLFNGSSELVQVGSGVRVSQPYVLTSAHLFSRISNYKSVEINVRFGKRTGNPYVGKLNLTDSLNDLALVQVSDVPNEPGCPYFLVTDVKAVPAGSDIYFLGFPIDGPLRISPGILSIDPDPNLTLWQTDARINPGNSGGPAFTGAGYFIGIAKGILSEWRVADQVIPLAGISQFVPAPKIQSSPVGQKVLQEQADLRCLRAVAMRDDGSFGLSGANPAPLAAPAEFAIANTVIVEWNKGEDAVPARRVFPATSGYAIGQCTFERIKVVGVEVYCTVGGNGEVALLDLKPTGDVMTARIAAGRVVLEQRPR